MVDGESGGRFQVRSVRLRSGARIPVLCWGLLPVYEATFWTLANLLPKGNAYNTMTAKLRVVGHWLTFCERKGLAWVERVRSGRFLDPGENAEVHQWMGIPIGPRGSPGGRLIRVAPHIHNSRLAFLRKYLCWEAERAIYRLEGQTHSLVENRYEAWKRQWNTIEGARRQLPQCIGDNYTRASGVAPNR